MAFLINSTPVMVLFLALINSVAADVHYIGPTAGGIVGLVSRGKRWCSRLKAMVFSVHSRLFSFWISLLLWKLFAPESRFWRNCCGSSLFSFALSSVRSRTSVRCSSNALDLLSRFDRLFRLWPCSIDGYLNQSIISSTCSSFSFSLCWYTVSIFVLFVFFFGCLFPSLH